MPDDGVQFKDFEMLRHGMNSDLSACLLNRLADIDFGGFLRPKKLKAAQSTKDMPKAE